MVDSSPTRIVTCKMCGYEGRLDTYLPNLGYHETRCPKCRSTYNQYNQEMFSATFGKTNQPEDGR